MRLVIDADAIVYRAGFASETRHVQAVASDANGKLHEGIFNNMRDVLTWTIDNDFVLQDKHVLINAEPVAHALFNAKRDIHGIIKTVCLRTRQRPRELDLHILLTGPDNFRESIATIVPYKGNRDPDHKPTHYQAIRNYLTDRWSARVITGIEADDKASILCWELIDAGKGRDFVIATIDKDLDQVPGLHYDYRQKVFFNVDPLAATMAFWQQVLAGDATDNIKGCYGIGRVKAERMLRDSLADFDIAGEESLDERLYGVCLEAYADSIDKDGCPYTDREIPDVVLENARLVYMLKKPDEMWNPPCLQ